MFVRSSSVGFQESRAFSKGRVGGRGRSEPCELWESESVTPTLLRGTWKSHRGRSSISKSWADPAMIVIFSVYLGLENNLIKNFSEVNTASK